MRTGEIMCKEHRIDECSLCFDFVAIIAKQIREARTTPEARLTETRIERTEGSGNVDVDVRRQPLIGLPYYYMPFIIICMLIAMVAYLVYIYHVV